MATPKRPPPSSLPQLFISLPEQLPPVRVMTTSDWVAPTELPDLSHETEVAIDTETRDDMLAKDKGPGFYAYEKSNPNTGFICGISVAWRENSIYICLLYTSPSPRDRQKSRMPSSA